MAAALGMLAALASAQRSHAEALGALREGNRRHVEGLGLVSPPGEGARRSLARGESPRAIVLSCSDSRVGPEHVFHCSLGELFVVRVAGACVDPETLAGIEYAAEQLGVQLCVVLTHEDCESVRACAARVRGGGAAVETAATQALMERLEPAVRKAAQLEPDPSRLASRAEEEQAHVAAAEIRQRSPLLQRLWQEGRFRVVSARYHLATGVVEWLPERPLPAAAANGPAPAGVRENIPPHVALRMLQAGHRRFLSLQRPAGNVSSERRLDLTHGQSPIAVVVACADSRVGPEILFDAGLGELAVVRVWGSVLNDDVLASVEHAVLQSGAPLCIVLGHSRCAAVAAATADVVDQRLSPGVRQLLGRIEPSVERARSRGASGDGLVELATRLHVQRFVQEARSRSPALRARETEGRFAFLAASYDLETGDLSWLPEGGADEPRVHAAPAGETASRVPEVEDAPTQRVAEPARIPPDHARPDHAQRARPQPTLEPRSPVDPVLLASAAGLLTLIAAGLLLLRRRR